MNRALVILVATATLALAGAARAGDDGFGAFWKVFAPAMAKDDQAALAGMTGPALGPFAAFHAQYLQPAIRRCIAAGKPASQPDGQGAPTYYVKCGQTDYVFYKVAGVWKLNDMELDD